MNKIELKRRWDEQQSKLMEKFTMLKTNDLIFAEGEENEMLSRKQKLLWKQPKKELHKKIIETL